ncbi:hypothetical protein ACWGRF_26395 [Streptomyces zhihengii]
MGFFSKRPAIDHAEQDRQLEQAKREFAPRLREIHDRLENGSATSEDKRIFNAGRTRGGRIQ